MVKQAGSATGPASWRNTRSRRYFQRSRGLVLTTILLIVSIAAPPASAEKLRILHTNDMHAHLEPFVNGSGQTRGGFARLATLVARERAGAGPSLLLNAGDLFQGTPYYNFFHGEAELRCLSLIGCDAMTLGNHEFDDGAANLLRQVKEFADFPIVCANITVPLWMNESAAAAAAIDSVAPPERVTIGPPYVVREFGPLRVGLVGVTTEELPLIVTRRNLENLTIEPVEATLRRVVPEVRRQADLVILLSHCGLAVDSLTARTIPGIDVIVSAHDHQTLPHPILVANAANGNGLGGTLLVETGFWAENLGRLDLDVDPESGRIASWSGELLPVTPDLEESPAVAELIRKYRDELEPLVNEVIGQCRQALPDDSLLQAETALGNWVTDRMREAARTDIALENGGGLRSNLQPGPIRVADVYKVLPFENTLVTMRMNGRQVEALCQEMIGLRGRGGFGQVSGLTLRVTTDGRVRDVRIGGTPLDPDRTYSLVTNNFTASGGDGYTIFKGARDVQDTGWKLRDVVIAALRRTGMLEARVEGRIVFEP